MSNILSAYFQKLNTKGSFLQSFTITLSGTSLAFLIQLVFSPIISRIYDPAAYGEFALFNLILTNFVTISGLAYPDALLTQRKRKDYLSLSLLIIVLSILFALLYWVVYLIAGQYLEQHFPQIRNKIWLWFIPVIGFVSVNSAILLNWNVLNERYKRNVSTRVVAQIISKLNTIGYGLLIVPSGFGIILGDIIRVFYISFFLPSKSFYTRLIKSIDQISIRNLRSGINSGRKLINYPKYVFPGNWLNMFSGQLPIIFIPFMFGQTELGAFAFAGSIVAIPSKLVSNAIRPVFFQKSQIISEESGLRSIRLFTRKVALHLLMIGLIPFLILYTIGPQIFEFVFGPFWIMAGKIASLSSIHYAVAFIASPLSSLFFTLKREKLLLAFQILLFAARILCLLYVFLNGMDFLNMVFVYAITNAVMYMLLIVLQFLILRKDG